MIRLLLLLLLTLPGTGSRAEGYAQREDVQAFVQEMHSRHGFDADALNALFRRTKPIAAVIKAIMPPKDPAVRSWHAYRGRFVEPRRIAVGRRFMRFYAAELAAAEARFGVPADIIAAIIGVETIYGKQMGRFGTFAALTTLAFDYPPRAELFRKELEELLLLAREEDRNPLAYTGSYAGAIGLPQFLPSSRRRFAVDFDHDGRIDLATSPIDAIGSVANFLAGHGWEKDAPIAIEVTVAGGGVQALIDEGITPLRTPREMEVANNVALARVGAGDAALEEGAAIPDQPAALIDFITPGAATEYRLGYRNFYVITRYNRSSFYAAAVMDLATALRASK
ncbi:MAG: lytic murein transglycosylase B [Sulfuritalea sp.]|jgi:membrane-bound lytic murein transglycosylase B|nr:lytic murein transglycosylase B [Sulfuritalea sp.]